MIEVFKMDTKGMFPEIEFIEAINKVFDKRKNAQNVYL